MDKELHWQNDLPNHQEPQKKSVADKRCDEDPNLHQESETIPAALQYVITLLGNYAASHGRPYSVVKSLETMHFQHSSKRKTAERKLSN